MGLAGWSRRLACSVGRMVLFMLYLLGGLAPAAPCSENNASDTVLGRTRSMLLLRGPQWNGATASLNATRDARARREALGGW